MRKFLIGLSMLVVILLTAASASLYKYPYLPAIVEEGFPAWKWPARGTYVNVKGIASKPPLILESHDKPLSAAGEKLHALLKSSETDALVAYHKGKLKYAYFRDGLGPDTQFNSYSMAKSLIGYLVLKAIEEKKIAGLESSIGTYLPMIKDQGLRDEPIERFLKMRSGLEFEEKSAPKPLAKDAKRLPDKNNSNPFSKLARMHIEGVTSLLDTLKLPHAPKYEYHYQNVNTALLGAMLTSVYKQSLNEILSDKIWKPAGARQARWRTYTHDGAVTAYCCLFATVEDWAKVGIYLSRNGVPSNDTSSEHPSVDTINASFISPSLNYVLNAQQYQAEELVKGIYGLHVRHDILNRAGESLQGPFTYFLGHGGQLVYLKPEDDLVVVRFGRKHTLLHSTLYFLWREIMAREAKAAQRISAQRKTALYIEAPHNIETPYINARSSAPLHKKQSK